MLVQCLECLQVCEDTELCPNPICTPGLRAYQIAYKHWEAEFTQWREETLKWRRGQVWQASALREEFERAHPKPVLAVPLQPVLIPYLT